MFQALLTYFAAKRVITFVVMVAMMIGLLAVVCIAAVFAPMISTEATDGPAVTVADTQRVETVHTSADAFGGLNAMNNAP